MLPGKTYKPEDVLKILRKRFWMVLVPWAVIAAGTAGVARKLPDMYRSFALIQVTPAQVPNSIVQAQTTGQLDQRLQAIQQTILSRTRLEGIIQKLGLYEKERKTEIMEDVVQNMRDDIHVASAKGESFTVEYEGRNPVTVMKVTEELASLFKEESMKEGERRAEGTSTFVESQVEDAKRKLQDTEDKMKKYKLSHSGELPQQIGANMQAIQSIQMQLQSLTQSLNGDTSTRLLIERQIADLEGQTDPAGQAQVVTGDPATTGSAAQRLTAAKAYLAGLQARGMLSTHPDYQTVERMIHDLEKQAEAEALRQPVGAGGGLPPGEAARQKKLAALREDLEQVKKQIDAKTAVEKKLRSDAAVYQARIDAMPTRDVELIELNRDYETLTRIYNDMLAKRETSNMAVNLANRQIGEQFTLLDAARLPQKPFSPNRTVINILGVVGGLAVGLGLVALFEYRDKTFKTDSELATVLALPVLAVVPVMKADSERKAEFRKTLILNMGLASVVLVCLAVLTYSFVFVR